MKKKIFIPDWAKECKNYTKLIHISGEKKSVDREEKDYSGEGDFFSDDDVEELKKRRDEMVSQKKKHTIRKERIRG